MSIKFSIKVMLLLWRCGLVDGLTMIQFLANAATQYATIVVGSSIGNNLDPSVFAAPIAGLGTSYQNNNRSSTSSKCCYGGLTCCIFSIYASMYRC